eukprot:1587200-Amphidinium_carterae.1
MFTCKEEFYGFEQARPGLREEGHGVGKVHLAIVLDSLLVSPAIVADYWKAFPPPRQVIVLPI